ncbi:PseG/SpsG family protein [Sporosarcina sp. FA9]|uniref:PseG/SpsG family protein n=1 Tax=Sporosarcina sp. FA9 TaxID=3413030 RepID=UPI003F65AB8C
MILIDNKHKKKVVIHISHSDGKGTYPERRAETIARTLEGVEIIFLCENLSPVAPADFRTVTIAPGSTLLRTISEIKPDILLRDTGSTLQEEVERICEVVPTVIHFDDFGEGGKSADIVFQTLYSETNDKVPDHYIQGIENFIVDEQLASYKNIGLKRKLSQPLPHLVISFGDEDTGNLSYRALRHMLQLQIPLKVTVLVGENYSHDVSELQMMALGRRNTFIQTYPYDFHEAFSSADIILCASGYMPFEVAVMGIPCVVVAQNDFELSLAFPKEQHGFIHLGTGRKIKQSSLLNAIMEPLLHESLRKKAIARQTDLGLGSGKDTIIEAIYYCLEYPKRIIGGEATGKETSDMLQ